MMPAEWTNTNIFDYYNNCRRIFRKNNEAIISEIFHKNISQDSILIELGSGIGELSTIIPSIFKGKIIEIEKSKEFSLCRKLAEEDTKLIRGDIIVLPLKDEIVNTVVSYSVFDTIHDLGSANKEVCRVLKNDGIFIHILDLQPNIKVLMEDISTDLIPFPFYVNDVFNGFSLIKKNDYEKIRSKLESNKLLLFDLYVKNPYFACLKMLDGHQNTLKDMALTLNKLSEEFKIVATPTFDELFMMKMQQTLKEAGFKQVLAQNFTKITQEKDSALNKEYFGYNFFENYIGSVYQRAIKSENDMTTIKATLQIIIAQK